MYPHFTVRVTPSCHDWHLRIAISDIVDLVSANEANAPRLNDSIDEDRVPVYKTGTL
jgi:hypothetical protein